MNIHGEYFFFTGYSSRKFSLFWMEIGEKNKKKSEYSMDIYYEYTRDKHNIYNNIFMIFYMFSEYLMYILFVCSLNI